MPLTFLQPKCQLCEKTVYLVDQLRADGVVYHRACFRCNHCKGTLKRVAMTGLWCGMRTAIEGQRLGLPCSVMEVGKLCVIGRSTTVYCKLHFDQLLKQTGSFDKSFDQQGCMKRQPKSESFQSAVLSSVPQVTRR